MPCQLIPTQLSILYLLTEYEMKLEDKKIPYLDWSDPCLHLSQLIIQCQDYAPEEFLLRVL